MIILSTQSTFLNCFCVCPVPVLYYMTTPEVCQYSVSKFNIFSLIFKFCIKHVCCWLARARPGWAPAAASIRGRGGGGAASARHHRTTFTVVHNIDIDVYMQAGKRWCCHIIQRRPLLNRGFSLLNEPNSPVQLELGCCWGFPLRTSIPILDGFSMFKLAQCLNRF